MPMECESAYFLGASAMKVESKYEAEPITWQENLERAKKYVQMGAYTV